MEVEGGGSRRSFPNESFEEFAKITREEKWLMRKSEESKINSGGRKGEGGKSNSWAHNIRVTEFSFTWQIQFGPINNHYYGVEERLKKI